MWIGLFLHEIANCTKYNCTELRINLLSENLSGQLGSVPNSNKVELQGMPDMMFVSFNICLFIVAGLVNFKI